MLKNLDSRLFYIKPLSCKVKLIWSVFGFLSSAVFYWSEHTGVLNNSLVLLDFCGAKRAEKEFVIPHLAGQNGVTPDTIWYTRVCAHV